MLSYPSREELRGHPSLASALADLARVIGPGGDDLARDAGVPRRPIVLVVGTPRAGSTLALSWLARSGRFAVPSGLVARFWRAPAVGALVERLLFDADFSGDAALDATPSGQGPHDAPDLWRHFLGFGDPPLLGEDGRARADVSGFRGHLAAWERVAERPLAMKALIAAWELPFVAAALPTALFLDVQRDPLATMASLLAAREQWFGDRGVWYSIRPPVPIPSDASPEEQVAIQVRRMREAIDVGLSAIEPHRVLRVSYEDLCTEPAEPWRALADRLAAAGETLPADHPDERTFRPAAPIDAPALARAWELAR